MEAYSLEWLNFLGRWFHMIAGIAWIGASFYFVWLDAHLHAPRYADEAERLGIGGEVWAVHGGGFYRAQKFKVAPPELPEPLHWFKWEAYSTWLSGMFMLVLVYWLGASVYLVDPAVAALSPGVAVAIAAAPAPAITKRVSSMRRSVISSALISAAPEMIAVPCWSS
jgi:uncharacterized membrane protein